MKLRTIWTLPAMTLKDRLVATGESLAIKVAWKLPQRVLYWATVRAACIAEPNLNPSDVTVTEMMEAIGHD
jgi:hypothetical protein